MLYDSRDVFNTDTKEKERTKHHIINSMHERAEEKKEQEALQAEEERQKQEKAEQQQTKKKITLIKPRWIHKDTGAQKDRPKHVYIGDTILLAVDQTNADSRSLKFKIHDNLMPVTIDPERLIQTETVKVENPSPEVEWKVNDPRNKTQADRDTDVYFMAMCSEEYYSDNCEILIKERIKELFHFSI